MFSPKHPRLHCWKSQILETKVWTRSPIDLHASIHSISYKSEGPPGGLSVITWFTNVTPTITNIKLQTHGSNACKLIFRSGKKDTKEQVQCKATTKLYLFKMPSCLSGCVHAEVSKTTSLSWARFCTGIYGKTWTYIMFWIYGIYFKNLPGFHDDLCTVFHQQIPSQTEFPPYQSPAGRHPLPPSLAQKLQPLRLQLRLVEYVAPWNKGHDGICTYLSPGIAHCLTFDPWYTCDLPQK